MKYSSKHMFFLVLEICVYIQNAPTCEQYENVSTNVNEIWTSILFSRDLFRPAFLELDLVWCNSHSTPFIFLNTIFVSSHMYPENPDGSRVNIGRIQALWTWDMYAYPTLPDSNLQPSQARRFGLYSTTMECCASVKRIILITVACSFSPERYSSSKRCTALGVGKR